MLMCDSCSSPIRASPSNFPRFTLILALLVLVCAAAFNYKLQSLWFNPQNVNSAGYWEAQILSCSGGVHARIPPSQNNGGMKYDEPFGHHLVTHGGLSPDLCLGWLLSHLCEVPPFRLCWLLKGGGSQAGLCSRAFPRPVCTPQIASLPLVLSLPVVPSLLCPLGWESRTALLRAGISAAGSCPRTRRESALVFSSSGLIWVGDTGASPPGTHRPRPQAGGREEVENNLYVPLKENTGWWLRKGCVLTAGKGRRCSRPGARLARMEQM